MGVAQVMGVQQNQFMGTPQQGYPQQPQQMGGMPGMQSPPSAMNAMTGGISAQQKAALEGKSPAKAAVESDFGSFETAPGSAVGPSTADKMSKLVDLSGGLTANDNPAQRAAKEAEMMRVQAQSSFGGIDGLPAQQRQMGDVGGMGMGMGMRWAWAWEPVLWPSPRWVWVWVCPSSSQVE